MTHYEVLGVSSAASKREIRRAYIVLARRYHPDFHAGEAIATTHESDAASERVDDGVLIAERIRAVNEAWAVLGDDVKRRDYDLLLAARCGPRTGSGPERASAGPDRTEQFFTAGTTGAPSRSRINRPSSEFTPFESEEGVDGEKSVPFRYSTDAVNPRTVPSKVLLAAPGFSFALGIGLILVSIPTAIRALTAFGLIFLFVATLLFIGAPIVALFKSRDEEVRASGRP